VSAGLPAETQKSAVISACGLYRYALRRVWDAALPELGFVLLNPSDADAEIDDPTLRRMMGFGVALGYGGVRVGNLYAYRTPKPSVLRKAARAGADIVGPENDRYLLDELAGVDLVIGGWGRNGRADRVRVVRELVTQRLAKALHYLRLLEDGTPEHPLYLPGALRPMVWAPAGPPVVPDDTPVVVPADRLPGPVVPPLALPAPAPVLVPVAPPVPAPAQVAARPDPFDF